MKINKLFIILLIITSIQSCKKDEGPIIPDVQVNQVSFVNNIQPIFDAYCTSCHPSSGNLDLTSANSYNQLVNVNASNYSGKRVIPNDADNSVLYKKIDGSGTYGSNMPLGGNLSQNQIDLIKQWINEGAKNN